MAGENLPLMKVNFGGDSQTYYANAGQHVTAYQLARGEVLSVEAENILAFTGDCDYNVRFLGMGVVSQKGIATSTLTGARRQRVCGGALRRQPAGDEQSQVPRNDFR